MVTTYISHISEQTGLCDLVKAPHLRPEVHGMKPLTLILAFSPLIVFSLLSRLLPHGDIGIAGLAAALVALAVIVTSHPIWPPKILNTCSFVLFAPDRHPRLHPGQE